MKAASYSDLCFYCANYLAASELKRHRILCEACFDSSIHGTLKHPRELSELIEIRVDTTLPRYVWVPLGCIRVLKRLSDHSHPGTYATPLSAENGVLTVAVSRGVGGER